MIFARGFSNKRRHISALLHVFLPSLGVAVVFMAFVGRTRAPDYVHHYRPIAKRLVEGRGLTNTDGSAAIRYPPGYSVVLAAIYGSANLLGLDEEWGRVAVAVLSMALSSVLVYNVGLSIWNPCKAWMAAAVWMTYPLALWNANQPGSEMLFTVLLFAGFTCFWRGLVGEGASYGRWFLVGVLAGLAMLVRPIGIGLGLVMAALLVLVDGHRSVSRRILLGGTLLLGNALTALPWQVWAYSQAERPILLSSGGVPSIVDGLTFALNENAHRDAIAVPDAAARVVGRIYDNQASLNSLRSIGVTLAEELRRDPAGVASLLAVKAARSWYATYSGRREGLALLLQLPYLLGVVSALFACFRLGGKPAQLAICICAMLLYFWVMTVCALSIVRYMVPAIGLSFVSMPSLLACARLKKRTAPRAIESHPASPAPTTPTAP